ncbi:MAG: DUF2934 domain-containing protein [Bacteroidetes bacterium]|nr:DUF2934 domain-containing protein [Bacteroidota bacterium]
MPKAKSETKGKEEKPKTASKKEVVKKESSKVTETKATVKPGKSTSVKVTHDQIAARAYEIYLSREQDLGDEMADWVKAEQELTGGKSKAKK